ncbi:MAG: hypothetical protein HEP71_13850 [Roseivirga sp.]|nr:hypothetical protein [Roseivirga sp.]
MRRLSYFFILLSTFTLCRLNAAEIVVPGVSGITFDDTVPSVTITDDFTVEGMIISPQGLTLTYASDVFKLFGAATVKLGTDEITVSFGTESSPGLQVTSGSLDHVSMGLTADFSLKSMAFSPQGLSFEWDGTNDIFEIYGAATVGFDSEMMTIGLGDADSPGIEINAGTVEKVNLSVSADFNIKDLSFSPDGLTFQWDSTTDNFEMFGGADVSFDSETMTIGLGDADAPGIEINAGTVEKVNLSVSADFNIKDLGFSPSGLTFEWDSTTDNFEIYGGADVSFDSETMTIGLGDADTPGIEINAGTVEKVNLSVSADFNIKDLNFSPDGLTFQWDSTTDNFEIYGGADVSFDSETMTIGLGDAESPGIEINAGTVEKVNLSVSANFNMKSLLFRPQGLTFQWDSSSDEFEIYGAATVGFDSETMTIGLGDADAPGIEISGGTVEKVNLSVSADFNIKDLSFSPDGLTFQWDGTNDNFEMYGGADVSFDSETMTIGLGDADVPGIEISGGTVEKVNLSVSADFNIKDLSFSPDGLTFQWDGTNDNFEMYGGADVSFDSEMMTIGLGDADAPGIEISGGTVEKVNLSVSADFNIKDLSFSPDGLTFQWDKSTDFFEIYGAATVSFDSETLKVSLGDENDPGIELMSGVVEHINMGITASFDMKGMGFTADGLTFEWDKAADHFEIYGSASTTFDGESIAVLMGNANDPGIVINSNVVQHINMGITADFKLKTMEFEATGLTYHWDKSANQFEIYGSTAAKFDGEEIDISLGTDSDPGIAVKNKVIQRINMGLTGDFNMKAFAFKPTNLTFQYDKGQNHFEMYGSAKFTIEGHDATISMGSNSNPGMVFQNGNLKHINLSITEDFELKGLTVKTSDVGVVWDSSNDYFNFHGDIKLSLGGEDIEADMGTSSHPGMQFRNGNLHSFDVTVNSDFKLGNLEVTTKNVNVKYSSSKFEVSGTIEIDEVWSVEVQLGNNGSGGLEIITSGHDKIKVDDFTIDIQHVDLGAIDFKEVKISFRNDAIHEAKLDVSIPPGYEVTADMTFAGSPARLNSIDIAFDATNFDSAIPIGDTGIELVHIEGGMFNLANPSTRVEETLRVGGFRLHEYFTGVYFKGSIAFTFGGPVSLAGHEAALIYQEDDVTISGSGVFLEASLLIGAYRHSHNNWRSILGDGSIGMNLIWGRSYSVNAHMKIPSDPLVEFNANAKLSASGNFDALIDVKLKVPHSVPIVGGKTLGSVDGGIRYNPHHLSSSYGAGWASYWFFGRHHFGARYKFSNRHVDVIGSGTVSSIEREIRNELGSRANLDNSLRGVANMASGIDGTEGVEETVWVKDVRSFEIPPDKSSIFVELDMGKQVDEAYVSVIGPDGFYDIYEIEKTEIAEDEPPLMELTDRITKFEADSAANLFIINHEPEDDSLQHQFSTLTPGQYDLLISYRESNNVDSVGVRVNYFHPVSFGEISAEKRADGLIDIDMEYWAHFPDSTQLSVFWNDTAAYTGEHIGTLDYGIPDESGFAETSLTFNPKTVINGDSLYFYFVLQDSTNAPVYSNFTSFIEHESAVSGAINITNADEDTPFTGMMVFIDENGDGFYDTEGTGGAFEPSSITDQEGKFHFNNLVVGQTYTIDVVVPYGFSLADGEAGVRTFTYTGVPQTITFNLTKD